MITIHVNGQPAPQGSKRPVRLGNGKIGMVEQSKAVGPWREAVRGEVQRAAIDPLLHPVDVSIRFRMPRPKGHYRSGRNAHLLREGAPAMPGGQPDLDKLIRSTLDALKLGGAYTDDAQVCHIDAWKVYGATPGADITVRELEL